MPSLPLSSQLALRLFPSLLDRVVIVRAIEPSTPVSGVEHVVHASSVTVLGGRREEQWRLGVKRGKCRDRRWWWRSMALRLGLRLTRKLEVNLFVQFEVEVEVAQ